MALRERRSVIQTVAFLIFGILFGIWINHLCSIPQQSQPVLPSHFGTATFDQMRVCLSGGWIKRQESGNLLFLFNARMLTYFQNTSHGLPTRSRIVSKFMVGLEKTKAKSGDVSQSARALSLDDMHRLYKLCMSPTGTASFAETRWGIVRYVCQLQPIFIFILLIIETSRRPTYLHGLCSCAVKRFWSFNLKILI
jgi:hypothetical protein